MIVVPDLLAGYHETFYGEEGRAWIARLPALAEVYLRRWGLRVDGTPMHGMVGLVLPVLQSNGVPAALKVQPLDPEHLGEEIALRVWGGQGSVGLLAEDETEDSSILLLERLDGQRSLKSHPDIDEAVRIIAELLARLHSHAAPAQIRPLDEVVAEMIDNVPMAVAAQSDSGEARLLTRWGSIVAELNDTAGNRLLHWDLHYENVLAAGREPWLAIDPKPLAGHPGFDLQPALQNRWSEIVHSGHPELAVRRRFDQMTEIGALDRAQAAAWTFARMLQNEIWYAEDGEVRLDPKHLTIAAALESHLGATPADRRLT